MDTVKNAIALPIVYLMAAISGALALIARGFHTIGGLFDAASAKTDLYKGF